MTDMSIADIKSNSLKLVNVSIRTAINGFVVSGQTQYQDKGTKTPLLADNSEGVASTASDATGMALNYVNTGSFEAPSPPPVVADMFATSPSVPIAAAPVGSVI